MPSDLPDPEEVVIYDRRTIEHWRQETGLSKRALSRAAGFNADYWSDVCRKDIDIGCSTAARFIKALREYDGADDPTPGRDPEIVPEARPDGGVKLREGESPDRIAHLHGNERLKRENEVGEYARGEDR